MQKRKTTWMEETCSRLFGETEWQQEVKLKRLLIITAIIVVLTLIGLIEKPSLGVAVIILWIIFLIWGWSFISTTARKAAGVITFFNNDMTMFVLTIVGWLMFGAIVGVVIFIIGIIRFVQIKMS